MPPPVSGVLETALYVESVPRALRFYREIFDFPLLGSSDRIAMLDVPGPHVLLLCREGASTEPVETEGGVIPPHDASGPAHLAFAIERANLDAWEDWLVESGVEIESRVSWDRGGESLYFRDPDGHALELVTPGTWETY